MIAIDGSWAGQAAVGHLVTTGVHAWLVHHLGALGFQVRVHCAAYLHRPVNTGRSHWQLAIKMICKVRQYVTGG